MYFSKTACLEFLKIHLRGSWVSHGILGSPWEHQSSAAPRGSQGGLGNLWCSRDQRAPGMEGDLTKVSNAPFVRNCQEQALGAWIAPRALLS